MASTIDLSYIIGVILASIIGGVAVCDDIFVTDRPPVSDPD